MLDLLGEWARETSPRAKGGRADPPASLAHPKERFPIPIVLGDLAWRVDLLNPILATWQLNKF